MGTTEDTSRLWALAPFGLVLVVLVGYVVTASGLDGHTGLEHDVRLELDEVFGVLSTATVGLVLTWLRPCNPIGWLISLAAFFLALCDLGQAYGARSLVTDEGLPFGALALSVSAPLWIPSVFIPASLLLVRYPQGRVNGRWARRFDRVVIAGLVVVWAGYAGSAESVTDEVSGQLPPILLPEPVAATLLLVGIGLVLGGTTGIVADAVRRALRGERHERLALVWLLTASVIAVTVIFFGPAEWMGTVSYFGVLAAVAVGVLRYQALGIEVVVRRALVYSILTGLVLVVFVGVVAAIAQVVPSGPAPQVVGAVLIAVGLAPARDRIQAVIDRLLYGDRDDPFAALQRLGTPIGSAPDEELLPAVLTALREALHVDSVQILPTDAGTGVPLVFGGKELGRLEVAPRRGERALGKADRRLVEAVAPLVATVVHAVDERDRIVQATQLERKRLRQELHDGLGPSLTGVGLGLEAAQRSGADDELLRLLRAEVASSLEEVRRIIEDLRPTALDDEDLLGALRRRAEQVSTTGVVTVHVDAPASLPQLPPPVAAAAFRIADEALVNVVRHASARHCRVQVRVDDQLTLEVADDGVGPGDGRVGGVGLTSMRERAERLGGRLTLTATHPGTSVLAELPLGSP